MDFKNTAADDVNEIYLAEVLPDTQLSTSILSD